MGTAGSVRRSPIRVRLGRIADAPGRRVGLRLVDRLVLRLRLGLTAEEDAAEVAAHVHARQHRSRRRRSLPTTGRSLTQGLTRSLAQDCAPPHPRPERGDTLAPEAPSIHRHRRLPPASEINFALSPSSGRVEKNCLDKGTAAASPSVLCVRLPWIQVLL